MILDPYTPLSAPRISRRRRPPPARPPPGRTPAGRPHHRRLRMRALVAALVLSAAPLPLAALPPLRVNVGGMGPGNRGDSSLPPSDLNSQFAFELPDRDMSVSVNYDFGKRYGLRSVEMSKSFFPDWRGLQLFKVSAEVFRDRKAIVSAEAHAERTTVALEGNGCNGRLRGLVRREILPGRLSFSYRPIFSRERVLFAPQVKSGEAHFYPRIDLGTGELRCDWLYGRQRGGCLKLSFLGSNDGSLVQVSWLESRVLGGLWTLGATVPLERPFGARFDVEREVQL